MVLINKAINEVTVKLVYYGPGLCGKTTNLEKIYSNPKLENKGKMISMATETDRTLFFDFMPMELGTVGGQKVRVQLYTVPGQVFYDATRKLVLRGAGGARILEKLNANVDTTIHEQPALAAPDMRAMAGATAASTGSPKLSMKTGAQPAEEEPFAAVAVAEPQVKQSGRGEVEALL